MAPGGERIVDVDELLGQLVEVEPALGVTVHFEPSLADRLDRSVTEIEARAFERRMRSLAKARLGKSSFETGSITASFPIMIDEVGLLQPEAELDLAELR